MFNLLKKNQSITAVDITSSSVKILETSFVEDKFQVQAFGRDTLRSHVVESGIIKDVEAVAASIRRAMICGHINNSYAALAVPDAAAITKIIQINEGVTDVEIEELITFEADKYFPYPIEEINIDFEILGPSVKSAAYQDVLIVGTRSEIVNTRVEAARLAGLETKIIEIESHATERAVRAAMQDAVSPDKIIAVIDIGNQWTHLSVLHNYQVIFTREEEFGGKQLIEAMVSNYQISAEEANQMIQESTYPEGFDTDILNVFKESLVLQIKRTLQFFFSTGHYGFVDHIVLGGGVARLKGIDKLVSEQINILATVINPLKAMMFNKRLNVERLLKEGPSLLIACGLGLRRLI